MKKLISFLRHYKAFSLALVTVIIGLILELTDRTTAAKWLLSAISVIQLIPLLVSMWQDLRIGKYGIDILAASAIIASVILGQYWAAIVIVLMLTGGEGLEKFAQRRAKKELDTLLKNSPAKARVIRKGKVVEVKAADIHTGDKIVINAGDTVPVDALVIEGAASFDESSLTGESLPQTKQTGSLLLSGSINLDGPITAKATASAEDSQYQQIIKLVRAAASSQAPFVRLADRYSIPFTVLAYAIAVAAWLATGDAMRFLEVIVVATPCPLLLAAPIAVISGMSRASRYGIIVKSGTALERLAGVRTIAFDKTGTLTKGLLEVESVTTYGKASKQEVLSLAASLEQNSNHIIAQAVVKAASHQGLKTSKAKHVKELPGRGLVAQLKGKRIIVGKLSLLEEHDVNLQLKRTKSKSQSTEIYVSIDDELAGLIKLNDELRDNSSQTINDLRKLGIKEVLLVTGDNMAVAESTGKQVGISEIYAGALPADKLKVISEAKLKPVAFVGDGVNDAPVLTAANVGIALGAKGSTAASESADMVIMPDDISRVATAVEISKRTFTIARQSILIGIALSVILMLVFATGKFSALTGALVQEVVDVIVIFNALRAHLINPSSVRQD